MQSVIRDLVESILEVFGFKVAPKLLKEGRNLPIFLKSRYVLYSICILDKTYVLAFDKNLEAASPSQILKHMKQLEEKTGNCCIYVARDLPAYNRKRLMTHRVRFVVPKTQMYLPDIGIDWRRNLSQPTRVSRFLTPSAQTVVIYSLIHGCNERLIPSELAKKLGYSRMTMTRALNELELIGLGKTIRRGKERCFYFQSKDEILWKKALPLMQTPIKEVFWIQVSKPLFGKIKKIGFTAGLTALAEQSVLSEPSYPVFALFQDEWKRLMKEGKIRVLPISEGASMQLEIWNYDPDLFDENRIVDPFSLYLSFQGKLDERLEKALIELMEKIKW